MRQEIIDNLRRASDQDSLQNCTESSHPIQHSHSSVPDGCLAYRAQENRIRDAKEVGLIAKETVEGISDFP